MNGWLDEIFAALEEVVAERRVVPVVPAVPAASARGRAVVYRGAEGAEPARVASATEIGLVLAVDPYHGELEITPATLVDRTQGDRLGRLAADGNTWADFELSVAAGGAGAAARRLFGSSSLSLRLVLADGSWLDFAVEAGTLSIDSADGLRFSVRLPSDWLEQDRDFAELLAEVEEAVFAPAGREG